MLSRMSDKRKAKGEKLCWNSTIKAKAYTFKKSPLRKVSRKSANLWEKARKECLERDNFQCILCGEKKNLHCHHFQFKRTQKPEYKYLLDNLCIVCNYCHNKIHQSEDNYENGKKKILSQLYINGIKVRNLEEIS